MLYAIVIEILTKDTTKSCKKLENLIKGITEQLARKRFKKSKLSIENIYELFVIPHTIPLTAHLKPQN